MTQKSEIGRIGEDLARDYLEKRGYRIIERNAKKPWGELDIVAVAPDKTLVFIEVKTMSGDYDKTKPIKKAPELARGFGGLKPEDQMTKAKLRKFRRVASLYAGGHQELIDDKKGWRLDVVAVDWNGQKPAVRHYENI